MSYARSTDQNYKEDKDDNNQSWLSIGGGGGCGTCNSDNDDSVDEYNASHSNGTSAESLPEQRSNLTNHHSNVRNGSPMNIMCGESADENSLTRSQTPAQVTSRIQLFTQYLSSTCEILEVFGGGGGGGGTAECALPLSFGYGFSFHYISTRPTATEGLRGHSKEKLFTKNTRLGRVRKMEDSDRENEYIYDVAGALLKDASVVCGGYTDWCCVSGLAGRRITQCLSPNGTQPMLPAGSSTVSCDTVVQAQERVSWLLNSGGCNSTEQQDNRADGSDSASGSTSGSRSESGSESGSGDKCSSMQSPSYPFGYDNSTEDEHISGLLRSDKIARIKACLERDDTSVGTGVDSAAADVTWATYATALTHSDLFGTSNLYIKDNIYCIDLSHINSSAFCTNSSTVGYCDSDGSLHETNSVLKWSDFFQQSINSAGGSIISDPLSVNVSMAFAFQTKVVEYHTNIMVITIIALILLNIFNFFVKTAYQSLTY